MHPKTFKKFSLFLIPVFIFLVHLLFVFARTKPETPAIKSVSTEVANVKETKMLNTSVEFKIYDSLKLNTLGLSKEAFNYAIKGYNYLRSAGKLANDQILSIVDFSLPSSQKRLFVIDMENFKMLYNTYVAHGRNSGKEYASQFSNAPESFKSSLGFYVTKGTYNGEHGFSLQLEGEEKNINDNASSRAIVVHSADYVNERLIKSQGYIGRSLGCPALPKNLSTAIIQTIKNGTCLFMFSPNSNYVTLSPILKATS
jgi:L,D-transpeptidase catalytic domain